jgi:hypothetical protein
MKINDSIDNLKETLAQANEILRLSEKSINSTLNDLMKQVTPDQMPTVQRQIMNINNLMKKAKKGENIDAEISQISKTINNGR